MSAKKPPEDGDTKLRGKRGPESRYTINELNAFMTYAMDHGRAEAQKKFHLDTPQFYYLKRRWRQVHNVPGEPKTSAQTVKKLREENMELRNLLAERDLQLTRLRKQRKKTTTCGVSIKRT